MGILETRLKDQQVLEVSFDGKSKEQWDQAEWKNEGYLDISLNRLLKLREMADDLGHALINTKCRSEAKGTCSVMHVPRTQPDHGKTVSTIGRRCQGTAGKLGLTVLHNR